MIFTFLYAAKQGFANASKQQRVVTGNVREKPAPCFGYLCRKTKPLPIIEYVTYEDHKYFTDGSSNQVLVLRVKILYDFYWKNAELLTLRLF